MTGKYWKQDRWHEGVFILSAVVYLLGGRSLGTDNKIFTLLSPDHRYMCVWVCLTYCVNKNKNKKQRTVTAWYKKKDHVTHM